jgi:hypothetical protein
MDWCRKKALTWYPNKALKSAWCSSRMFLTQVRPWATCWWARSPCGRRSLLVSRWAGRSASGQVPVTLNPRRHQLGSGLGHADASFEAHLRLHGKVVNDRKRLHRLLTRHDPHVYPGQYITCVHNPDRALCRPDANIGPSLPVGVRANVRSQVRLDGLCR